ncbi:hypothetical protein WA1_49260 [Scytonema hofmannii PCC 7110]|uniref:Uncharacterized protein n=1 Tax=Scytonema hofmannii PCC 7110 TaxID=128403 RepID=A0A139WQM2_9CYAN|nr:hypothetical protein [Scytonema hofmannii]KYC34730.1 hypothetical protein WA1_49260 [Scytonema hofmannii PCC 7110]
MLTVDIQLQIQHEYVCKSLATYYSFTSSISIISQRLYGRFSRIYGKLYQILKHIKELINLYHDDFLLDSSVDIAIYFFQTLHDASEFMVLAQEPKRKNKGFLLEEHQYLGQYLRRFMRECVIFSEIFKEMYGSDSKTYQMFKTLFYLFVELRGLLSKSLVKTLSKQGIDDQSLYYYMCNLSDKPEVLEQQRIFIKPLLALFPDLNKYMEFVIEATCLCDCP